jgi:hypothetical protein
MVGLTVPSQPYHSQSAQTAVFGRSGSLRARPSATLILSGLASRMLIFPTFSEFAAEYRGNYGTP